MKQTFRVILAAYVATSCLIAQAPPAAGGGRGRGQAGPQIKAVEVHEDRTVTFRLNAPTANQVTLVANFLPGPLRFERTTRASFRLRQNLSSPRSTTITMRSTA